MNLTIFKRLALGYIIILVLVIFMGGYISVKLNLLHHLTWKTAASYGQSISMLEHLLSSIYSIVGFEKKYIVSGDQDYYQKFQELHIYFLRDMDDLDKLLDAPEQRQLLMEAKKYYKNHFTGFQQKIAAMKKGSSLDNASDLSGSNKQRIEKLNTNFHRIIDEIRMERDENIQLSSKMSKEIRNLTLVIASLTIILGFVISIFNTRSITRSISLLKKKTKEIADGKFEAIESIQAPKEIEDLSRHFNVMCSRLKELDTMKLDFISHVSHELRTPMTVIKEASIMLDQKMVENTSAGYDDLLKLIQSECERLIKSVNRILDLSRMEGKMMDYHFIESDLSQVIRNALLKLVPLVQKKEIDLEFVPPPVLPLVKIDQERIGEVLENVLGNAIKYTPQGGNVKIKICLVPLENELKVTVSDTGCGIPAKNLADIFDKFKRIDNFIETQRGTGLGLSITKHIINAHGGKIWAESKPLKGTKVLFTLPFL